jgi:Restriction endonuclease
MAGRGDEGLLITTGTFSADAKKEATRDGAPPIDLIDGDRLCDLLKRYERGVKTETRTAVRSSARPPRQPPERGAYRPCRRRQGSLTRRPRAGTSSTS